MIFSNKTVFFPNCQKNPSLTSTYQKLLQSLCSETDATFAVKQMQRRITDVITNRF